MNFITGPQEVILMDSFKEYDIDMAQKIMDEMFVFDDILGIDDKGIQTILRDVQSEVLITALKGTGSELREKIFKNMSTRAADMMRDDLENKGPVKLSDVEGAQKEILQIVRTLFEEGQIMLSNKGDESYV
jgi:flagellar motor switch protein FliG